MKWVTDEHGIKLNKLIREMTQYNPARRLEVGEPHSGPDMASVEKLRAWGMVGIYEVETYPTEAGTA